MLTLEHRRLHHEAHADRAGDFVPLLLEHDLFFGLLLDFEKAGRKLLNAFLGD